MAKKTQRTYYDYLEIDATADMAAIKSAYRKLARKYHPDVNPNDTTAEKRFKEISEAYDTLSDNEKRQFYDQALGILNNATRSVKTKQKPQKTKSKRESVKKPKPKPSQGNSATSATFREMFDSLFKKEGPASSSQGGQKQKVRSTYTQSQPSERGEDVTVHVTISPQDASQGLIKTVSIHHAEDCKRCSNTGRINGKPCQVCQGEKQLITVRKIDVRIPANVKEGSKVRVAREGGKGLGGGEPGDLFLAIHIEDTSALKIDGATVTCTLPISITEAVLGAEIEVPTLNGSVNMVIPPLTNSGKVFRLKGQGAKHNGSTGDQLVTVAIVTPKSLSNKEKDLYKELAKLHKENPRQ